MIMYYLAALAVTIAATVVIYGSSYINNYRSLERQEGMTNEEKKHESSKAAGKNAAIGFVIGVIVSCVLPFFLHQHKWEEWRLEKAPGCETTGTEVRTCSKDSSHQERRTVPALGHDWIQMNATMQTCLRCGKTVITGATPTPPSTPSPTPSTTPTPTPKEPDYEELKKQALAYDSKIEVPTKNEMLYDTVVLYVRGSYPNSKSGGMYLNRSPGSDAIVLLKPHTPVTVHAVRGDLASKSGYAFVETGAGQYGWVAFRAKIGLGLCDTNDFTE